MSQRGVSTRLKTKSTRKIKVLRIIDRLNIGGPAIHTILLTAGMNKDRFNSLLVTGTVDKDEGDMFFLAEEKKVRPIIITEMSRSLVMFNDITAFLKLFFLIKKERPDIIHTHKSKAGTLGRIAGLLFKLTFNPKLVHTFHGHVLHSYFGKLKSLMFTWIERILGFLTDKIIVVSESVRRELIELKIASPEKIVTIPLGLELGRYLKIENKNLKKNSHQSVGIIGRLVPVKNHKMFLDAAKQLLSDIDFERRMKFLIIGDGPLRQNLEVYSQKWGLTEDVIFKGWIKNLKNSYSDIDIVVLTSLNEGTPVALIEAMAAGKPVISTDVGGVKDLFSNRMGKKRDENKSTIRYYDQGIFVDSGDVESLAQAIKELLKDDGLRKKMGIMGRKTVYPKYDISRLIDDLKGLYLNLTGGRE